MKIDDNISLINQKITNAITSICGIASIEIELNGRCSLLQVQNEQRQDANMIKQLIRDSDNKRMTINSKFKAQGFHVLNGGGFNMEDEFGDIQIANTVFRVKFILISTDQLFLDTVLDTFAKGIDNIRLDSFVTNTEQILTTEMGIMVGQNKNIPSGLRAILINYRTV